MRPSDFQATRLCRLGADLLCYEPMRVLAGLEVTAQLEVEEFRAFKKNGCCDPSRGGAGPPARAERYRCRGLRCRLSAGTERQLLRISTRSIDYRLRDEKRKQRRRLYGRTKPGTLLKHHKPGYISPPDYEFCSVLKFVEERWRLHHLTARDHWANDMRDCFDFTQNPRPARIIPVPPGRKPSQPILDYTSYPPSVPLPEYVPAKTLRLEASPMDSDKK